MQIFKKISMIICFSGLLCFTLSADTTFLAHYNGDTDNYGFDADYAAGSETASTDSIYWPSISTARAKYGSGSVILPWWSGKNILYSASQNYNNQSATIEFYVDTSDTFDGYTYLFDGQRRYVFDDDLGWGNSGHVDIWFDGTLGSSTSRLVAHIHGDRDGQTVDISLMGPANLPYTPRFVHYAIQWDCQTGKASVYYQGFLASKVQVEPWNMSNSPNEFVIGMSCSQVGEILLDELKISDNFVYDNLSEVSERVFDLPIREYPSPGNSKTTFLAHYNGDTGNDGLDADYSLGSYTVTIPDSSYGVPAINASCVKFGTGAVEMPWWSERSMVYQAEDNYNNLNSTIDFQLNLSNIYQEINGEYVFDGVKRYVFNDDITWGESGHVDIWVDGTAGEATARVVVHLFRVDNDCITLIGPAVAYSGDSGFCHYAVQWDCLRGIAALYKDSNLESRVFTAPWVPENLPSIFEIGMQSPANTSKLLLDEFRISNDSYCDFGVDLGQPGFEAPDNEYSVEIW